MFDFENLAVYQKAKQFNSLVIVLINEKKADRVVNDQLKRAAFSIVLNIAEGSSRFKKADRKNFFVIARGSVFECVAIFDVLKEQACLNSDRHFEYYSRMEELSKILFAMIRNLE